MRLALAYVGVTIALVLVGRIAAAQIDLIPFTAGEVIRADEVNRNFQRLADAVEAGALPQTCEAGELAEWNGASWVCGRDDVGEGGGGGDITAVAAGEGLTGGGASGDVTLAVGFEGSGAAATVARSDHEHMGQTWAGASPLILDAPTTFDTTTGGVLVLRNSGGRGAGLLVSESSGYGLWVRSSEDAGLVIDSAGGSGVYAFAEEYGAELHGRRAGLAVGGSPRDFSGSEAVPDIILTGNSCSPCGPEDDDGRVHSDPFSAGSDIFLVSNDAVVVQLDANRDEEGHFQVQNQTGAVVFQVAENGDVRVNGALAHSSDRALKHDGGPIDTRQVLERLAALPIHRWSFIADDAATPHLGPMAQDFNAAFELGADERYIGATDADGVALAAIQGLYQLIQEQQARIGVLEADLATLRGD